MKLTAKNHALIVYAALIAVSLAWIGLIFAAPWLMAERRFYTSMLIYHGFSAACHQISDRSFYAFGFPLAVCSRCIGIYCGFIIGLLLYPFVRNLEEVATPQRKWLFILIAPAVIDFAGGLAGVFQNSFLSRTSTGLLAGAILAFYVLPSVVSSLEMAMRHQSFGG